MAEEVSLHLSFVQQHFSQWGYNVVIWESLKTLTTDSYQKEMAGKKANGFVTFLKYDS